MLTIIESDSVSEAIDKNQEIYPRLEDAFDALKWWLARNPESGELIDDYHWLYKQRGNKTQKIPALVVIYSFNHNCVELVQILIRIPSLD